MELLGENKVLFRCLFLVAVIIIIVVIWLPKKSNPLSKHDKLTEEEVDKTAIKKYGDELQLAIYSNNLSFLKSKILDSYLEYNKLTLSNYSNWLEENNILTTNIKLENTTKYIYGDTVIYSIDVVLSGNSKKINIIETYPEVWTYTFDTFVNFNSSGISQEYDGYGAIINSIYQDINYISFNVSLYVKDDSDYDIDISKNDAIKLIMDDDSSFIMATNDYTSEDIVINSHRYITVDCIYHVGISEQTNISSIVIGSFLIDGEERSIKVNLDI